MSSFATAFGLSALNIDSDRKNAEQYLDTHVADNPIFAGPEGKRFLTALQNIVPCWDAVARRTPPLSSACQNAMTAILSGTPPNGATALQLLYKDTLSICSRLAPGGPPSIEQLVSIAVESAEADPTKRATLSSLLEQFAIAYP